MWWIWFGLCLLLSLVWILFARVFLDTPSMWAGALFIGILFGWYEPEGVRLLTRLWNRWMK